MHNADNIQYAANVLEVQQLTGQEAKLVQDLIRGIPAATAAKSVGIHPDDVGEVLARPHVARVVGYLREQMAHSHAPIEVTRDMLTSMYFEAWHASANATEMRLTVDSLARLHGLNAPTKTQVEHSLGGEAARRVQDMSNDELARLAGQDDIDLDPADYSWSDGSETESG